MDFNKRYEENINTICNYSGVYDLYFGTSFIQRVCKIGYNEACHTIEYAIERKVFQERPLHDRSYSIIKV